MRPALRYRRFLLTTVAISALLSNPVSADDLEISGVVTTPVATSSAANGTPGDITITPTGIIDLATAGAAVTIDSDNSVENGGLIDNSDATGAIGVQIEGGVTGSFVMIEGATIAVRGTGTDKTGILVTGAGDFFGDIDIQEASTIRVDGDGSVGIAINTGMNGDLTLDGSLLMQGTGVVGISIADTLDGDLTLGESGRIILNGEGSQAILVTGEITGVLANSGNIEASGPPLTPGDDIPEPHSGSALAIGGDIGGGIFNGGPAGDDDDTPSGVISSRGSAPAILISPSVSGGVKDVTIGVYDSTLHPNFSLFNRGTIDGIALDPEVDTTAIRIEGDGGFLATLTGGIFSSGLIRARAEDANATAIAIGADGIVPNIRNEGQILASVTGDQGGVAQAVVVEAGGSLTSIFNSEDGLISATATVTEDALDTVTLLEAYAVRDLAGTITSIVNEGTIRAAASSLESETEVAVAVDLSVSAQNVTFENSGDVIGDVLFGSGNDTFEISQEGSFVGEVHFGAGTNVLKLDGGLFGDGVTALGKFFKDGGTLDITVDDGRLRVAENNAIDATTMAIGATGTLEFILAKDVDPDLPFIVTSGETSFADGAQIDFTFTTFLNEEVTFQLIDAGTLTIGASDMQDLIEGAIPFLFAGELFTDPGTPSLLELHLKRKTAEEMGLRGNALRVFDQAILAMDATDELGAAFLEIDTQEDAQNAFDALTPDVSGGNLAMVIGLTDQATSPVGARQRALRMYARRPADMTLWGQEFVHAIQNDGDGLNPGYRGDGFGFMVGGDSGDPESGRYGIAFGFFTGDASEKAPRDTRALTEWYLLSLYSNWKGRGLFFDTQATFGYGDFNGRRDVHVGDLVTRTVGDWSGYLGAAGFSTGFIFAANGTVFAPQISLDGTYLYEDAFEETGLDAGVDLAVGSRTSKSLRGFAGFAVRQDLAVGDVFVQPELRGGYRYEFLGEATETEAEFLTTRGAGGSPFTVIGPEPVRGTIVGGASLAISTETWSLGFSYDVTSTDGALAHYGVVTLLGRI